MRSRTLLFSLVLGLCWTAGPHRSVLAQSDDSSSPEPSEDVDAELVLSAEEQALVDAAADVNIAILDSCASGAFTRTKGGKREAAFLVDESSKVTGYAFICWASQKASNIARFGCCRRSPEALRS